MVESARDEWYNKYKSGASTATYTATVRSVVAGVQLIASKKVRSCFFEFAIRASVHIIPLCYIRYITLLLYVYTVV